MSCDRDQYTQLMKWTAMCGVVILALLFVFCVLLHVNLGVLALVCGLLSSLVNLKIIALFSDAVLRGTLKTLPMLLVLVGKISAFLVLVLLLSLLPTVQMYSFLIGFFSFIPGAVVMGVWNIKEL